MQLWEKWQLCEKKSRNYLLSFYVPWQKWASDEFYCDVKSTAHKQVTIKPSSFLLVTAVNPRDQDLNLEICGPHPNHVDSSWNDGDCECDCSLHHTSTDISAVHHISIVVTWYYCGGFVLKCSVRRCITVRWPEAAIISPCASAPFVWLIMLMRNLCIV